MLIERVGPANPQVIHSDTGDACADCRGHLAPEAMVGVVELVLDRGPDPAAGHPEVPAGAAISIKPRPSDARSGHSVMNQLSGRNCPWSSETVPPQPDPPGPAGRLSRARAHLDISPQ